MVEASSTKVKSIIQSIKIHNPDMFRIPVAAYSLNSEYLVKCSTLFNSCKQEKRTNKTKRYNVSNVHA